MSKLISFAIVQSEDQAIRQEKAISIWFLHNIPELLLFLRHAVLFLLEFIRFLLTIGISISFGLFLLLFKLKKMMRLVEDDERRKLTAGIYADWSPMLNRETMKKREEVIHSNEMSWLSDWQMTWISKILKLQFLRFFDWTSCKFMRNLLSVRKKVEICHKFFELWKNRLTWNVSFYC